MTSAATPENYELDGAQMTAMKDARSRFDSADSATVKTDETMDRRHNPAALNTTSGNPLQLLIAQRMDTLGDGKPMTLREVEERSGRSGGKFRVSRSTVSNVLNGKAVKLTPETITGLSRALQLDETLIEQAINQTVALTLELPSKLRRLSPEGWRDLLEYGEFLLSREGK